MKNKRRMPELTEFQKEKLKTLKRKQKTLNDSKGCILETLMPVLNDLEKIRLEIDAIELDNKYGEF